MPVIDHTSPTHVIRDHLIALASAKGQDLSRARADKLAKRYRHGGYDPDHARVIDYADPTGETAVGNVLRQQKKIGDPGAHSAKNRTETANTPR